MRIRNFLFVCVVVVVVCCFVLLLFILLFRISIFSSFLFLQLRAGCRFSLARVADEFLRADEHVERISKTTKSCFLAAIANSGNRSTRVFGSRLGAGDADVGS